MYTVTVRQSKYYFVRVDVHVHVAVLIFGLNFGVYKVICTCML